MNEQMVEEFHVKFGFARGRAIELECPRGQPRLWLDAAAKELASLAMRMETVAHIAEQTTGDVRLARLHLIVEEVAELAVGFHDQNEIEVLDALADLAYVTYGTAVAYGLPLDAAFREVHRSNMTKEAPASDGTRPLHPAKGDEYEPPRLALVLEENRS